jgi:hypothetical protein
LDGTLSEETHLNWHTEWHALEARIDGLMSAAELFLRGFSVRGEDPYDLSRKQIIPQARDIFSSVVAFAANSP